MLKNFEKNLIEKNCDQGVHDHDVQVNLVHISEGGKVQISPKLELYRANQDQIRSQRPRLRRNRLILGRKAVGGCKPVPKLLLEASFIRGFTHNN